MVLTQVDPKPIPDYDTSTTYTGADTPPETEAATAADLLDDLDPFSSTAPSSSVPWPGATFILRCAATGQVLTLLNGQVVLAAPGGRGAIHWACVEAKGWLGFRSGISGRFLGHDAKGRLVCAAERQQGWENFCVRLRPEGGYVLLMTHFERLWRVGVKVEQGVERLVKMAGEVDEGMVWEFVKV